MTNNRDIIQQLDALGLPEARRQIARGVFGDIGSPNHRVASAHLDAMEKEEADSVAQRKEARENESIHISRQALRNSKYAARIATLALALSIVLAIQKATDWLSR